MSQQHIPFDIQSEIMKRLPVKSLLRFRSVSKSYKSLIHNSDFIANYTSQHQHQHQHLLIRYSYGYKYVSVVDDGESFPTQWVSLTLPDLFCGEAIGSSHGLFCFYNSPCLYYPELGDRYDHDLTSETGRLLIFNPCIRKTLAFDFSRVEDDNYTRETVLGFGVCRETMDPKIVKVTLSGIASDYIPWQVEVFTLSTRAWRNPYSTNFPSRYINICMYTQVVLDGCLYWLASDMRYEWYFLIISFDMTSEEFKEVNLPDSLAHGSFNFALYKLGESLAVVQESLEDHMHKLVYDVWMMVDDDPKWFKMLYTISSQSPSVSIFRLRGFRKTGEPLVEVILRDGSTNMLAVYDPYSKSITNVGIDGSQASNSVYSYTETLLLL